MGGVVAVGGDVVAGRSDDGFVVEVKGEGVGGPGNGRGQVTAVHIQGAQPVFLGKEQVRRGRIGKMRRQNLRDDLPARLENGLVLVGEAVRFHPQLVGNTPALVVGNAIVGGMIPTAIDFGNGNIPLPIADAFAVIVHKIAIPIGQKGIVQPIGHLEQPVVIVE